MKTITPINTELEYYEYNNELKLVHLIKEDMFQCKSILDSLQCNRHTNEWKRNKDTKELIEGFKSMREFSYELLIKEFTFAREFRSYNGYYIHRLLVNHFAMWANKKYAYKISLILDDHFENLRLKKEINEKEDKIDRLERKIDELKSINLEQTEMLKRITYKISDIIDSLNDLKSHTTSNQFCRYKIIFWLTKEYQNKKAMDDIIISTFIGLNENKPKFKNNEQILIDTEVSCSLDAFKTALSNVNKYGFSTDRRKITIKQHSLEPFVRDFKYQIDLLNDSTSDLRMRLEQLSSTVNQHETRISKLEKTMQIIKEKYNIVIDEALEEIKNENMVTVYKNGIYRVKIDENKNILYIRDDKNKKHKLSPKTTMYLQYKM